MLKCDFKPKLIFIFEINTQERIWIIEKVKFFFFEQNWSYLKPTWSWQMLKSNYFLLIKTALMFWSLFYTVKLFIETIYAFLNNDKILGQKSLFKFLNRYFCALLFSKLVIKYDWRSKYLNCLT